MFFLQFFVLFLSTSSGFLLEKTTSGGTALSDQHYFYLLGLLTQERKNVQQMEQFILKLNNDIKSLQQMAGLNTGSSLEITELKNESRALQKELVQLKQEINILKNENFDLAKKNTKLQNKIDESNNVTIKLKTELYRYQASTNQKIEALETKTELGLQSYQNRTNQMIKGVFQEINAMNQTVAMTMCSGGETVSDGSVIKFPRLKTVRGISDVNAFTNSGKFTCEIPGIYLFSVFIAANEKFSQYIMYKNKDWLSYVYIVFGTNNGSNDHTGTGIVAVSLNVGDTLYVQSDRDMHVYRSNSCMTVVKIR